MPGINREEVVSVLRNSGHSAKEADRLATIIASRVNGIQDGERLVRSANGETLKPDLADASAQAAALGKRSKAGPHEGDSIAGDDALKTKTTQSFLGRIQTLVGENKKTIMGLTVIGTLSGYAMATLNATNNKTAKILSITIVSNAQSTGTVLTVAYDTTSVPTSFNPCIKDSIDFSNDTPAPFGGMSALEVTGLPTTSSIQVTVPTINIAKFPGTTSNVVNNQGSFTDHSSIENQFLGATTSVAATVIDAAANAANIAVSAAGNVAGNAICSNFKILCNKWLWIGIVVLVILGVLMSTMGKK